MSATSATCSEIIKSLVILLFFGLISISCSNNQPDTEPEEEEEIVRPKTYYVPVEIDPLLGHPIQGDWEWFLVWNPWTNIYTTASSVGIPHMVRFNVNMDYERYWADTLTSKTRYEIVYKVNNISDPASDSTAYIKIGGSYLNYYLNSLDTLIIDESPWDGPKTYYVRKK